MFISIFYLKYNILDYHFAKFRVHQYFFKVLNQGMISKTQFSIDSEMLVSI